MKHGSLFSGIGGFDLASEWMGWENVFQVEIDPFCTKVLEKNFPNTKRYGDIRKFPASDYAGRIDILTGGFPCQPFSSAGKRKGRDDNRHLWPEMLRVIREIKPAWVVAENVRGLLSIEDGLAFEQVCVDLENEGYEVQPILIPACAVNAPHKRERIWFIANRQCERPVQSESQEWSRCEKGLFEGSDSDVSHSKHHGQHGTKNSQSNTQGSDCDQEGQKEVCESEGTDSIRSDVADSECKGYQREEHQEGQDARHSRGSQWDKHWFEVATEFCGLDDGLQSRLDKSLEREYNGSMDRDRLNRQRIILDLIKNGGLIVDIETGDIFSTRIRGKEGQKILLAGCVHPSGYRFYRLHYKGEKYFLRGHQMVLWASGKDYSDDLQIDHIDRNKLNNSITNLRLVSAKENVANSMRKYGEENTMAKLTEKQVREIISYYATGDYSQRDLAGMYNIGKSQIHNIITGKSWAKIEVELGEFKRSKAGHRNEQIKAYGNAIVPQVAYQIFQSLQPNQ